MSPNKQIKLPADARGDANISAASHYSVHVCVTYLEG